MKFKERPYILFSIFAISVFLLATVFIYPFLSSIYNNVKGFAQMQLELALLQRRAEDITSFQKFHKENLENFQRIERMLVDSEAPIAFIRFLEETALNQSLDIDISSGEGMSFNLASKGSFPSFLKFLLKMESAPYLISETRLSITRPAEDDVISANLTIKVQEK